jgi:DNA-binding CsgD family transcriptional regulator
MEVTGILPPHLPQLYGREREQALIDGLIEGAGAGRGGALVLAGGAGAGRSSLLAYAASRADGMRVLTCHGDEAESELPFGGLHQLLGPVLHLVDELPDRLGRPFAGAVGLGPDGAGADRFQVSSGALALLAAASAAGPVLCLVDDAQWLDPKSAWAFSFISRRVGPRRIGLLATVRRGEGRPFDPAGVATTWLGGLEREASTALLAERCGEGLAPEVLELLVEQTAGVPLALVEAATGLTPDQLAGRAPLPRPLPLTASLRSGLVRPVRRLPPPAQRLLLLLAAAGPERLHIVAVAASELGLDVSALECAEAARLVLVDGDVVRFRDELVLSAVYQEATFFERRTVHLALARVLGEDDDGDRRPWHLAAAAMARDEAVAGELENAAERARRRSEPAETAAAMLRAAELTPDGPDRGRRLVAAAWACWMAGRSTQAAELVRRADRLSLGPLLGADVAELHGIIALREYDLARARESLVQGAEGAAASHPARALELLAQAGEVVVAGADVAGARALARRADALGGDGTLVRGVERVLAGRLEQAAPLAERAIAMAAANGQAGQLLRLAATLTAGNDLAPDALGSALDQLDAEVGRLRTAGLAAAIPSALADLAWLELWSDRHAACVIHASEGLSRAAALGQRWAVARCAMALAMLAAVRGQEEDCRALAELLLHPPGSPSVALHASAATWALALSDLGAGRFAEALVRFGELAPGARLAHPRHTLWSRPDAVEAAVRAGRPDAARAALDALERSARGGLPAPAAALLARARALLATGRDAERHYLAALALHAEDARPFQYARTQLLWAEHLRRNRRRADAREQLRSAVETFERLEARPWAARARAELRATGETVRRSAGVEGLTPQEIRIAYLVARGGSNREVAEQMFLSPRTVGYHLARVYEKLGVSSRTRLANLLQEGELNDSGESRRRVRSGLADRAKAAFRRTDEAARQALRAEQTPGHPAEGRARAG